MKKEIVINGQTIGVDHAPYIIAELSANHNGSIERAFEIIKSAHENGANAVKIQTYTANTMTIDHNSEDFMIRGGIWDGYKLYDLYQWAETPYEWHQAIFDYAKKIGITIFSTPFDETAVDLLESLNVPAYKIASFEVVDIPLIRYIAQTGKPIIMSTGMASLDEIKEAVDTIKSVNNEQLVLLHCISGYPTPIAQSHLHQMKAISEQFDIVVGLSDHTLGTVVSVAAVALGACLIEKHFTLDRQDKGPDSEFSLEPDELKKLCHDCYDAWTSLGEIGFNRQQVEDANRKFRRSIYFVKDVYAGQIVTEQDIRRIRPGFGLAPKYYDRLLGKKVNQNVKRGQPVTWGIFDD